MKIALFPQANRLSANGYSMQDEEAIFEKNLQDIIDRPRWYLDNLDYLKTYRVSWVDYKKGRVGVTSPRKYCLKRPL